MPEVLAPLQSAGCPDHEDRLLTRRQWVGALLGIGAFSAASKSTAQATPPEVAADVDPESLIPKLVQRISFGATEAEIAYAYSRGYNRYLEEQLDAFNLPEFGPQSHADRVNQYYTSPGGYLHLPPHQLTDVAIVPNTALVRDQLVEMTLLRAAYGRRQLYERMVEFWNDHFNIDLTLSSVIYILKMVDDREVVRPNALGTFRALLNASARSPAMLNYLNNDLSTSSMPNENYAREVMELHTMGVDGGYTQNDVIEVSRCLTGWRWWNSTPADVTLRNKFRYDSTRYYNAAKTVLGAPIPNNFSVRNNVDSSDGLGELMGMRDGKTVLNLLVNHPSTRRFIAAKLCRRFLSDSPSPQVIDDVAAAWGSDGNIQDMLRVVFQPRNLAAAPPKFRRPFHLFTGMLRLTNATLGTAIGHLGGSTSDYYRQRLISAGHHPFYWGPPDGYPETLDYWSTQVLPRWSFGASLVRTNANSSGQRIQNITIDPALIAGLATVAQVLAKIKQSVFLGDMPQAEWNALSAYLNDATSPGMTNLTFETRTREAFGLALGAPSLQWC